MHRRNKRMRVCHVQVFSYYWEPTQTAILNRRPIFLRRAVFLLRLSRAHRPAVLMQTDDPNVRLHLLCYLETDGVCWEATLDHFDASTWPRSANAIWALRSSTPHPQLAFKVEPCIRRRLIDTHGPPTTPRFRIASTTANRRPGHITIES